MLRPQYFLLSFLGVIALLPLPMALAGSEASQPEPFAILARSPSSQKMIRLNRRTVSQIQASTSEHLEKRDTLVTQLSAFSTTLSSAVNTTVSTITHLLGQVDEIGADKVVNGSTEAVDELKKVVDGLLGNVAGLSSSAGDAVQVDSASDKADQIASQITSSIAALENLISSMENQLASIPTLQPVISTLATIVNGPLSDLFVQVDKLLVGFVKLVGNLLDTLGHAYTNGVSEVGASLKALAVKELGGATGNA
ncbi:hypothetical protein T439DRAFT_376875 [Meredithblackwellia eburnea MCA 4105]